MLGERAEHAQFADIVFAAEERADIDKFSVAYLPECGHDFLLLRGREEPVALDDFAALDPHNEMPVNRAAHKPAGACDLID